MPAFFAYLLSISVFLGGGYFGMNFLAGNFDEPRQTVRIQSDVAHVAKEKRKASGIQLLASSTAVEHTASVPSSPLFETHSEEIVTDAHPASIEASNPQTASIGVNQTAEVKPTDNAAVPQENTVSVVANGAQSNASDQIKDKNTTKSVVSKETADANNLAVIEPKAKTAQTVTNASLIRRPMTTSIIPLLNRRSAKTTRQVKTAKSSKPALVKMVLQTIEFPDGRREQRLVSQRQAGLKKWL